MTWGKAGSPWFSPSTYPSKIRSRLFSALSVPPETNSYDCISRGPFWLALITGIRWMGRKRDELGYFLPPTHCLLWHLISDRSSDLLWWQLPPLWFQVSPGSLVPGDGSTGHCNRALRSPSSLGWSLNPAHTSGQDRELFTGVSSFELCSLPSSELKVSWIVMSP